MSIKIPLNIDTRVDVEFLELGILSKITRIKANICFKKENGFSKEYRAILDTGAPYTILPFSTWQGIKHEFLSHKNFPVSGISPEKTPPIMAKFGKIEIVFLAPNAITTSIKVKAYLMPDDNIPLIIGFEDIITKIKLFCNYKDNTAYIEI